MVKQTQHSQVYNGKEYLIYDLINIAKLWKLQKEEVPIRFLQASNYFSPCSNSLADFAKHAKRAWNSNLNYPIILSPDGFILDGKHRLAKAVMLGRKTIKAVQFDEMPDIGFDPTG